MSIFSFVFYLLFSFFFKFNLLFWINFVAHVKTFLSLLDGSKLFETLFRRFPSEWLEKILFHFADEMILPKNDKYLKKDYLRKEIYRNNDSKHK